MIYRAAFLASYLAVAALVLTACGTTPTESPANVRTVTVQVPVAIPCVPSVPTKPVFAVDQLPIGSPIDAQMRALRAERKQRIGYESELETSLKNCTARENVY